MIDDLEREKLEDPWAGPTVYIGLVGILATVVSIVLVHAVYYGVEGAIEEEQQLDAVVEDLEEIRTSQNTWIRQMRWTNQEKGLVGVPIDEGIRMVIDEHGRKP